MNNRRSSERPLAHLGLVVACLTVLFPFMIALSNSFKTPAELLRSPLGFVPARPTLQGWNVLLTQTPALRWLGNSVLVAVAGAVLNLVLAAPAAYAFARLNVRGGQALYRAIVAAVMLPLAVYLVPLYLIMVILHLLNTYTSISLPISESIFGVFLLTQFFKAFPRDFEDAARVDGATTFQVFTRIFVPMSVPAIVTLGTFTLIWKWNMFLWPLVAINATDKYPLTVGVAVSFGNDITRANALMAGALLIAFPIAILFFALQRFIIRHEVLTGLKG